MKLAGFDIPKRFAASVIVIVAVMVLAVTNNIEGEVALMAILGVAAALGVYQKARKGDSGS